MKQFISIILLSVMMFSCKKKVIENNILIPHDGLDYIDCACPDLEIDNEYITSPGMNVVVDETNYLFPQINPNNRDEFAYVSFENGSETPILMIYNIATQEKRILVNEWITGGISWGKKDWILFMKSEGLQLHKIKSNGDSLTPIGNGEWFHPSWNADGDKFVAFHKFHSASQPRTFILNENGVILDSIADWLHTDGNWSHPEYYLRYDNKNIYLMNLEENKVVKKISPPSKYSDWGFFQKVGWIGYDKLYFSAMDGQYVYNVLTDEVTHIRCSCGAFLTGITHSSDFSRIILARTELSLIENNQKYFSDRKLLLVNEGNLFEQEIVIP